MSKFLTAEQINNAVALCKDEPFSKASVFAITEMLPEAITHCKYCKYYTKPYCSRFMFGLTPADDDAFCAWGDMEEAE